MARFPFRIGYCCGKPARHTGVSHLLRLLVMQTCLWLSYHTAPTAVNISPISYLYRFTRSCYVFPTLAEKPPPPSRESRWDPPAHLWSARTGSRPAALWRLINSNFVPNTVLAPTFLLPDSAGGRAFARPPFFVAFALFCPASADDFARFVGVALIRPIRHAAAALKYDIIHRGIKHLCANISIRAG